MTAYSATFASGQTISLKNSKRVYAVAWKALTTAKNGREIGESGFARDEQAARKAAASFISYAHREYCPRTGRPFQAKVRRASSVEVVAVEVA